MYYMTIVNYMCNTLKHHTCNTHVAHVVVVLILEVSDNIPMLGSRMPSKVLYHNTYDIISLFILENHIESYMFGHLQYMVI